MENSIEIKQEKKPMRTAMKILVIAIILIFLVFLSIGIVKIVPKALNSLANASLSIGNVFSGDSSTTTNSGTGATPAATSTSGGGFSIRDLTNPQGTSTQNWVPAPAGTNVTNNANNNSNMGNGITSTSTSSTNTSAGTNSNNSSNTNTYTYTTNESGQASNPHYRTVGPSDIAVIVTAQGIISKTTGQFVQTNNFTTDDMVVIKFKIENRGLYATGPWSARVDMPSNDAADKVRTLGPINSLYAGSAITGEARFDNPIAGNQVVTINVDTAMGTQDGNRSNNIATAPIYTTGTNYGNGSTGGTYNPGGAADLQLTILQTGTVDAYGQFVANSYPRSGQKIAVRFQVTNVGGTTVPAWAWRADLSGSTYNTYTTAEAALAPGASTRIIVGFDAYNYGASTMTITADSNNQIYEANESNNTSAITVNVQ